MQYNKYINKSNVSNIIITINSFLLICKSIEDRNLIAEIKKS